MLYSQPQVQEIQFLEFMGGSNVPQAFPNYLICLRFIRINTVVQKDDIEELFITCISQKYCGETRMQVSYFLLTLARVFAWRCVEEEARTRICKFTQVHKDSRPACYQKNLYSTPAVMCVLMFRYIIHMYVLHIVHIFKGCPELKTAFMYWSVNCS